MNRANIKPTEKVKSSAIDLKKPITIKTLEWMDKAWATEDDFNKLYDMLVKEERYDEAMDVSMYSADKLWDDFIDDIDWPLYSKKSTPIDNYEARAAAVWQKKIEKLHSMAYDIVKKYASAADRRNIPRGVRGLYRPDWDIIAVKSLNDISLVAHEVAHAIDIKSGIIDDLIKEWNQPVISALKSLYIKNNPKTRAVGKTNTEMLREWFAEFIEWMVTEPIKTAWENPELLMFLNKEWGKMDIVNEMLKEVWDIVKYYQSLWALEKSIAKWWAIVLDKNNKWLIGNVRSIFNWWLPVQEKIIRFASDYTRPFEWLSRLQGKHRTIKDPSIWLRAKKPIAYLFARNFSKTGKLQVLSKDWNIKEVADYNLFDLVQKVWKTEYSQDAYGAYLVNRRYYNINKRVQELLKKWKSLTDAEKDELKEKTSQLVRSRVNIDDVKTVYLWWRYKYVEHDKMFDKFVQEVTRVWMRFWFIDTKYWKELLQKDWYAPFLKLIIDESNQTPSRLFKSTWWIPFWYKKFKGSDDPIINPLVWLMRLFYETHKKALIQETINRAYALAPKSKWAVKIVSSKKTSLWIFTPKINWNTVEFMRNWKIIKMELNNDLARVFKTDSELANLWKVEVAINKMMWFIVQMTTGIGFPSFWLTTNLMLDIPSSIAQAKNSTIPIYDWIKAMIKWLKKWSVEDKRLQLWLDMGWAEQTILKLYEDNPDDFLQVLTREKEGIMKDIASAWKNIGNYILKWITYSEIVNRFWEFSRWLDAWRSVLESWSDGISVSWPFANTWEIWWSFWRRLLRMALYWRSQLHVAAKHLDTMYYKETRTRWAQISLALAWAQWLWLILWYLAIQNSDKTEEEKKKLMWRIRNLSLYDLWNNFIVTSRRSWEIAKYRVPNNYWYAKTVVSMLIWNLLFDSWHTPKEFVKVTGDWLLPNQLNITDIKWMTYSWVPHLIQWIIGIAANYKSFPEWKQIVPDYLKHRPTHEQYTPYTGDLAIMLWQLDLAKWLKLSPLEIEYLMGVYLGRASVRYTKYISEPWWFLKWVLSTFPTGAIKDWTFKPAEYIFLGREIDKFYDDKNKLDEEYSSLKNNRKSNPKDISDAKRIKDIYEDVSKIMQWLKAIHREKWSVSPAYEWIILETINLLNNWKIDEAKKEFEKYRYQMQSDIRRAEMEAKYTE
jgi:hypothetical protein